MADVVIYTANFGAYDNTLPQVEQDIPVDWIYLTDGAAYPELGGDEHAVWNVHVVEPKHAHPNLAAKVYKAQPPWELGDWTHAIWIDANMQITEPSFAREAMAFINDGMATWAHPRRDCVYDEGAVCIPGAGPEAQNGRYRNLPLQEQMDAYRAEGYPEHNGLYASGTMIWTPPASEKVGRAWLEECERWGFQDQLALPVVCWRLDVQPGIYGISQIERRYTPRVTWRQQLRGDPYYLANRWLRIWPHAREATP